ncbi:hypothetical protein ACLD0W_02745 [Alloalcanivorax sp. C16-1]|uniref:hypothetical protein n=1 Tax=Alloalcanivorax sp. C16-1 TaxID=3390051 RepID=UPI003970F365
MAVGKSGRIVLEVEPEFKRELYDALHQEGKGLKQWFLESAEMFLKDRNQLNLFDEDQEHHPDEAQS